MIARIFVMLACLVGLAAPTWAQADPLASMTLEQKVGQMFMVTLHGSVMTEEGAEFLRTYQPGGVVLFNSNVGTPDAVTRLTNDYQQTIIDAGGLPLLVAIDQEGNVVSRLPQEMGYTLFPNPLLTSAAGPEMAYQVGEAFAEELSAVGINMNLAPVADLETNRENPIIAKRSYGSDPIYTGQIVAQVIGGLQDHNVVATVKHFPGHGETNDDSHGTLPALDLTHQRLAMVELEPFRAAVEANVGAVMVAHIWFTQIDSVRRPGSISPEIVTGLLREELGYDGLVMTDAMDMNALDMEVQYDEGAVQAVEAGVDIVTMGPSFGVDLAQNSINAVLEAVRTGRIPESRIDESVRRILAAKERFELMSWEPLDPGSAVERVNAQGHELLVEELFRQGVTVAYDRNDLLPVRQDQNIAVIFLATRYQIQNECSSYGFPNARFVGVNDAPPPDQIGWAVEAARNADVVVVFTQNAIETPEQAALVNALPPEKTIAVAIWSVYDWETYPNVAAYIATYSPARAAVPAACAIVFGAVEPHGTLPVTLSPELIAGRSAAS